MGLLAARLREEVRFNASEWLNDDDYEEGARTPAGVTVTARTALSLSTFWRCVDMLSSAASFAPKDVVLKIGGQSFPEFRNRPAWLSAPRGAMDPAFTIEQHFGQVGLSLLIDGNYFVHAFPSVIDPQVLTVLNPNRVRVNGDRTYDILDEQGRVKRTLDAMEILHGTWQTWPGDVRGISPLETLRRTLGAAIAAEDHAARFFGQGAALSFGVEVPYAMDETKKGKFAEGLKAKYAGLRRSHAIGVLTDGAKFVTGLAPTPEQAQMLETRKFAVEDIARLFGIPPGMVGSQEAGASSYASAETWRDVYKEMTLLPFVARIEPQYTRLLQVPDSVNDPNASMQFRFNLDAYLRADALKRMQTYREGIQSGVYTPNYARGKEDLAPLDGGDQLYMQAQMVPLTILAAGPTAPAAPATPTRSEPELRWGLGRPHRAAGR